LLEITVEALSKGYTISWDGDVSEKSFKARQGLAILPKENFEETMMEKPVEEINVNAIYRQDNFYNYNTTDDHLMHIVGTAKDQNGNRYFKIKNSWGEISDYKGYLYMSESFFLAKTVSIYLNKDALSPNILISE